MLTFLEFRPSRLVQALIVAAYDLIQIVSHNLFCQLLRALLKYPGQKPCSDYFQPGLRDRMLPASDGFRLAIVYPERT